MNSIQIQEIMNKFRNLPLVSTENTFGLLTIPVSRPGPNARHFFGSLPLRTFTTNGEPGIGSPSYKISIV